MRVVRKMMPMNIPILEATDKRARLTALAAMHNLNLLPQGKMESVAVDQDSVLMEIRGGAVLVDRDMVDFLSKYKWRKTPCGYAVANIKSGSGSSISMRMHQFVMGIHSTYDCEPYICDHINRIRSDNRRVNLRRVNHHVNAINRCGNAARLHPTYKGVVFYGGRPKPWYARVKNDHKVRHAQSFASERDAAIAYDIFARMEWGDFAVLNIPDATTEDIARVQALIENPKRYGGSSKFVGVTKVTDSRWVAKIKINGRHFYIATKPTEHEAAAAYNAYAIKHGGPNHRLNSL